MSMSGAITKLLIIASLVLGAGGPATVHAEEAEMECLNDKKFCFEVEGRPDIIIESLTILLPDVVGGILNPDKGTEIENTLGAAIGGVVKTVSENVVEPIITSSDATIKDTIYDIYFGEGAAHKPVAFDNNLLNSPVAIFEKVLTLFLTLTGAIGACFILGVVITRIIKLGFGMSSRSALLRNLIAQLPLFFLMALCLWPVSSGLPIFSLVILSGFMLGAFIASQFGYLFVVFFSDYLLESRTDLQPVFRDKLTESLTDTLTLYADSASSSISKNLFSYDKMFFSAHEEGFSSSKPSVENLLDTLETDEIKHLMKLCFKGYWQLNQNFSECDRLFVTTKNGELSRLPSNTSAVYVIEGQIPLGDSEALVSKIVSNFVKDKELSDLVGGDGVDAELTAYVRAVIDVSFAKMRARKELYCMDAFSINKSREYKKDWGCAYFDATKNEFDGVYAQSVMEAQDRADEEDVAKAKRHLSQKVTNETWETGEGQRIKEASKNLSVAMIGAMMPERGLEDVKVFISGSNAVSLAYDSVIKIGRMDLHTKESGGDYITDLSTYADNLSVKLKENITSEFHVQLANPDDQNVYAATKDYDITHLGKEARGGKPLDFLMEANSSSPLLLYVDRIVQYIPHIYVFSATATGIAYSLEHYGFELGWKGTAAFNFISKILAIIFYTSLLFLLFGFVSFLFSYVSLILSSFVRLVTHLMFVPIFLVKFVMDKSDDEEDEANVFFPASLKKVLERSWVDVLAAMASFVVAICLMSLLFSMISELLTMFVGMFFLDGAIVNANDNKYYMFLSGSTHYNLGLLISNVLVAGWLLMKGNKIIDYMYSKTTQFISDPAGESAKAGDDYQELMALFKKFKGNVSNKSIKPKS